MLHLLKDNARMAVSQPFRRTKLTNHRCKFGWSIPAFRRNSAASVPSSTCTMMNDFCTSEKLLAFFRCRSSPCQESVTESSSFIQSACADQIYPAFGRWQCSALGLEKISASFTLTRNQIQMLQTRFVSQMFQDQVRSL